MKSTKITTLNAKATVLNQLSVTAQKYNDLKDDFDALRPSDTAISADTISEVTAGTGVTIDGVILKDTTVDLNGTADALILDADGDTTISAPTDDQIDIEIAGADDFRITANTFTALSGSTIATNTIAETTGAAGVTIDSVLIKDGNATLLSVDAGATAGPELTLHRNSASPAPLDILGQITFDGEDSGSNQEEYARIQAVITDATATTEDGILQIFTKHDGAMDTFPQAQFSETALSLTRTDEGAEGMALQLNQISATPAAGDAVGMVKFVGYDDGAATQEYAHISGSIESAAAGAEDGSVQVKVAIASTVTTVAEFDENGLHIQVAGAVGTPAVSIGSEDTGLYQLSASQTGFAQDGVLVALFDEDGIKPDSVQPRVVLGSTPVGTVTFKEYGDGRDMTTVLTLTDFIVGTIPAADAALAVGNIVYAFPAGAHVESVYYKSISLTLPGAAEAAAVTGIGSVIGTTAVAVLAGTPTFMDRSTEITTPTASTGGAVTTNLVTVTAGAYTGIGLNVAGSIKNVFLNAAGTWVAANAGNLTATGTISFKWTRMA